MTYLVLDGNFLCHRAWHALGGLSHGGVVTSVAFGLVQELQRLAERFGSENFVFCFDHGVNRRLKVDPDYKRSRAAKEYTEEEAAAREEFRRQVIRLKKRDLASLGFQNVFFSDGYEADDVIASVVKQVLDRAAYMGTKDDCVLVSADKDLWQLLVPNLVILYNPAAKQVVDATWVQAHYGVTPQQWVAVKALAGCDGDDVVGVRGVGDTLAARYLRDDMNPETETYKKIAQFKESPAYEKNMSLVRLPFPGCPKFTPSPDKIDKEKWNEFARSLGMKTMMR